MSHVPVIDVHDLAANGNGKFAAAAIGKACRETGFFYVTGHGVSSSLQESLEELSREFFSQPLETKLTIRMALGGRAWRGYFRVGDELTSGKPDLKEGLYFGKELDACDPLVRAATPLHGPNLFPEHPSALREAVLAYMDALTTLGHRLIAGISLSLGLEEDFFARHGTAQPLVLFRIFNYPPPQDVSQWGVGEHTDYGLLTILKQDDTGGLEVKSRSGWIAAPPIPNTFICNIGDMLDRMTKGHYRSTPHRVRHATPRNRLSFPFFFDPNFFARMQPIELPGVAAPAVAPERWDGMDIHAFDGTYGEYLLRKVGKVFPQLQNQVL